MRTDVVGSGGKKLNGGINERSHCDAQAQRKAASTPIFSRTDTSLLPCSFHLGTVDGFVGSQKAAQQRGLVPFGADRDEEDSPCVDERGYCSLLLGPIADDEAARAVH